MNWGRIRVIALVVVGCSTLSLGQGPATADWEIVSSPNGGTRVLGNSLLGTAAISATDAWAVGAEPNRSDYLTATLAEHWDGTQWSVIPTPQISSPLAQLNSVTALASNDVWAAGFSENPACICASTVVEHWDGTSWTRATTPTPGIAASLYGISASSANDIWAVGNGWLSQTTSTSVILHYDGTAWSGTILPQYSISSLYTVFAAAPNDVWALGNILSGDIQVLALHWDGKSWKRVLAPAEPGGYLKLQSIAGTAGDDLWAVGTQVASDDGQNIARAFHWDGKHWTRAIIPGLAAPSFFLGLTVTASNDAWAVGQGTVLPALNVSNITYHWDGQLWQDVTNPDQQGGDLLTAVSASSATDVWAVGHGFPKNPIVGTFTMHYRIP